MEMLIDRMLIKKVMIDYYRVLCAVSAAKTICSLELFCLGDEDADEDGDGDRAN